MQNGVCVRECVIVFVCVCVLTSFIFCLVVQELLIPASPTPGAFPPVQPSIYSLSGGRDCPSPRPVTDECCLLGNSTPVRTDRAAICITLNPDVRSQNVFINLRTPKIMHQRSYSWIIMLGRFHVPASVLETKHHQLLTVSYKAIMNSTAPAIIAVLICVSFMWWLSRH